MEGWKGGMRGGIDRGERRCRGEWEGGKRKVKEGGIPQ